MEAESSTIACQSAPARPKRRWYQYSLRTLLIFVTLFAIACSWFAVKLNQARRQREAVEAIKKIPYAQVRYEDPFLKAFSPNQATPNENFLLNILGVDFFCHVRLVVFNNTDPRTLHLENLSGLESIGINDFSKGKDEWIEPLEKLPELRYLRIEKAKNVTDAALMHITKLTQLKNLTLRNSQISDSGLEQLKDMPRLEGINLPLNTKMTDAGLIHLKGMKRLKYLSLGTNITDAGLEQLRGLTELKGLALLNTKISDNGLVNLKNFVKLEGLDLSGTNITDAGLEHLKGLTALRHIKLQSTQITDAGLANLAGLTKLEELYLYGTKITDAGLMHLKNLRQLRYLDLRGTKVNGGGLQHLNNLISLETLAIPPAKSGVSNLQQALPQVQIFQQ
jgi:internalin A